MDIVVVGSVALDTIRTPTEKHHDLLGGSASYFSLTAIHLAPVGVVAVVGEDFPTQHADLLASRSVDLQGLQRRAGRTFRWEGEYGADPNRRRTLLTELGVFEDFHPRLPETYAAARALFLANIDPVLQLEVLDGAGEVPLVAVDTMNYWIEGNRPAVDRVIKRADVLLVNDEEAHMLTGEGDVIAAAGRIRAMGPEVVVVKKGAHGAAALGPWGWLLFPAYPVSGVKDPTGAGDSFAGGLIGHLAGHAWRDRDRFAEAMAVATAAASIVVEDYGVAGIEREISAELTTRCRTLRDAMRFDIPTGIRGPEESI